MSTQVGEGRSAARVMHVSEDGSVAFLELRNGQIATFAPPSGQIECSAGDVVLIRADGQGIDAAPPDLWLDEHWVGVVKLLVPGRAVIDISGRMKLVDRDDDVPLGEGNTVEGSDRCGVISVLSVDPLRYLDLPKIDSQAIDQYKEKPTSALSFDDFGGFPHIVDRVREVVELSLGRHAALVQIGARPIKGVLFTGPPGTGKTLLARIVANQVDAQFYLISGPEVLSKWYGQSEELIRGIFEDAARLERAVILFDEIDSLATQRSDESHEASRRVVAQLLTSMDGFRQDSNVVVIGTTNRLEDIDVALRRPGRFDWEIRFPLPALADRKDILTVSARGMNIGEGLPFDRIAELTEGWSAAELVAIWTDAALLSISDDRDSLLTEDYLGGFERVAERRGKA